MPEPSVGVYIHIPFCERVCPYCDFAVVAARTLTAEDEQRYVDAVLLELAARREAFRGRRLASIYLGGGTPSLLTPASVARLIDTARSAFPSDAASEITLEVNPSTLERERLPGFRQAGVNRVSVGVQSFDDRVLQRLGRAHRAVEADATLLACRKAGFEAISADLICAAPGQDQPGLEADLDRLLAFAPDHVSIYELTIEPGTPFALADRRRQLDRPAEDVVTRMLERIESRLGAAGLERYEISNYARPGFAAVHNRRYWEREPVLGLGMGAFSTDPPRDRAPFGTRRRNPKSLLPYLEGVESGEFPAQEPEEVFDAPTARGEAVFLALRTARGLDAAAFTEEFGSGPRSFFSQAIDDHLAAGLLSEDEKGDLRLTARGRLLADSVFESFV